MSFKTPVLKVILKRREQQAKQKRSFVEKVINPKRDAPNITINNQPGVVSAVG